ncbi:MAG: septum formation protein Maf [Clostridia bacterium]|nr:septum formation protein Maf [Clostridia bacterium]
MQLILASASPRRKDILTEYGYTFKIITADYEEKAFTTSPEETVKEFALGKATAVYQSLSAKDREDSVVLGADTVVSLDGKILGKPQGVEDAKEMLKSLSNRAHAVYTGYAIVSKSGVIQKAVKTEVVFNALADSLIEEYVATGKPLDKAGAYGIQDGYPLASAVNGSLYNVIGLPIEEIDIELKKILKK